MAYTSVIPVRRLDRAVEYVRDKTKTTRQLRSLQDAVDYALDRDKTESHCFETGLGCTCETAFEDMKANAVRWHKTGGVQGYHLVQSFKEGEVTQELAHRIGVELTEQLLGGWYQAIVTTHLNTKHYHNHIVWSAVALDNGRKYHSNAKSYYTEVRAKSDALCEKYGLSVIQTERADQKSKPYVEWKSEKENQPTWRTAIREDVDAAITKSFTWRQFIRNLGSQGRCRQMNYGAEPADQVVRYYLAGTEVALKLTGAGAKNFAVFVAAVLKDQKKTHGKTNLVRLLREQKPLKFFDIPADRMYEFAKEAKRHGLLYVPIRDNANPDMIEIAILEDDAAKRWKRGLLLWLMK